MLYGLLLKSSELSLLGNERAACMTDARDEDESWLLGLEAWVPCFALARTRSETASACQAATYGVSPKA